MAGIRGRDTRPEVFLRKGLFAAGFRYVLHKRTLPGRPDVVLPKWNAVVFINGCFWHGHNCSLFKWPATNAVFWQSKIERNRIRDKDNLNRLKPSWRVLTVWECALKGAARLPPNEVIELAAKWIRSDRQVGLIKGRRRPKLR